MRKLLQLGTPLEAPPALTVARLDEAGLLTLGVACWLARGEAQNLAAKGLVTAMVVYNLSVARILGAAGVQSQPVGIVLKPAIAVAGAPLAPLPRASQSGRLSVRP